MTRLSLIIFGLFFIINQSFAYTNFKTKTLKNGTVLEIEPESFSRIPYGNQPDISEAKSNKIIHELDSLYNKTKDLEYIIDIAYLYTLQKKYKEALEIYLNVEKIAPNRYLIVKNIVALYEYFGNNKKALEWFNRSMKSSTISSRLHSKILAAKIKGDSFIDTVNSSFFTGISFGDKENPTCNLENDVLHELIEALYAQLNERVKFKKPKNKIISLLLFELANAVSIQIHKASIEELVFTSTIIRSRCAPYAPFMAYFSQNPKYDDLEIYKLAKTYGYDKLILEKRIKFNKKKNDEKSKLCQLQREKKEEVDAELKRKDNYQVAYILIPFSILILLFLCFRKPKTINKNL